LVGTYFVGGWRLAFAVMAMAFLAIALGWLWRRDCGRLKSTAGELRIVKGVPSVRLFSWILFAFMYVGLEASIGQWGYSQLANTRGLAGPAVGLGVTGFWLALVAGRLTLGFAGNMLDRPRWKSRSLDGAVFMAVAINLGLVRLPLSAVTLVALPLMGLCLSIMLPMQYKIAQEVADDGDAARAVIYESTAGTLGFAVIPTVAGLVLQWQGPLALEPFLLALILIMMVAHIIARVSGFNANLLTRARKRP
jgi:fucose permease